MINENGRTPHDRSVRILGIGGGMSERSRSRGALDAALRLAEAAGAEAVLADVRTLGLPIYNGDWSVDRYPETLAWLLNEVRVADAFIFCSPTFHGTITGAVKNVLDALDYLIDDDPPHLGGKVVGLMALGGGAQNVINALHHTTRAINGISARTVVSVPNSAIDAESGLIADEGVLRRMNAMVTEVLDLTSRLRRPSPVPVPDPVS
ncbi:MAG: NADPH-dependent FMN reductase [Thermomicrobiales bacterium]